MSEKKILLIGIGKLGINAVKEIMPGVSGVDKLYIDSDESKVNSENYFTIPFSVELTAWSLSWPIKQWFESEKNEQLLSEYFAEPYELAICISQLGDSDSLLAKELMRWMQMKYGEQMTVYFIGTTPLRNQSDYATNVFARKMEDFLKENTVSYTLVDSSELLGNLKGYQLIDENICSYLGEMVENILNQLQTDGILEVSLYELCEILNQKGLIYYTDFYVDSDEQVAGKISNRVIPYNIDMRKQDGKVLFSMNEYIGAIESLHMIDAIRKTFGQLECTLRVYKDVHKLKQLHITILAPGKELNKKINIRKLTLL